MFEGKIFKMYWCWYEDYQPYFLYHESKTPEEFEEDCKMMMKKYGDEYMDQETSWIGYSDWMRYVAPKMGELGYELLKPVGNFKLWDGFIIQNDDMTTEEDNQDIIDIVGKKLWKKACELNNKLEKKDR